MSKKKELTPEAKICALEVNLGLSRKAYETVVEERDGMLMRCQGLEAKINGQAKYIESLKNERLDLMHRAQAADKLVMRTLSMTIEKAFKMGAKSTGTPEGKSE